MRVFFLSIIAIALNTLHVFASDELRVRDPNIVKVTLYSGVSRLRDTYRAGLTKIDSLKTTGDRRSLIMLMTSDEG
jgi:hypothetical protein